MKRKIEGDHVIHQRIMKRTASKSGKTIFRKKRIGDLIAMIENDKVLFGYSLCNKKDSYDFVDGEHHPGFGVNTAILRAIKWKKCDTINIPPSIKKNVGKFMERCAKYYKGAEMPVIELQHVIFPQNDVSGALPRISPENLY